MNQNLKESHPLFAVVVPIRGKSDLLAPSLESICRAVESCRGAVIVLVDNNPESVVDEAIYRFQDRASIIRSRATTIGAVRNSGVRSLPGSVRFIAFIDSDCVVDREFCNSAIEGFSRTGAEMVGCKVIAPSGGHWTERATDEVHRQAGDGPRQNLNSGCMCIRAEVFEQLGGFSEALPANEDYDLCERLRSRGGSIWQLESLRTIHLGNPKSSAACFRRLRWHGRGVVGEDGRIDFSPMLVMSIAHSVLLVCSTAGMILAFIERDYGLMLAMASLILVVPVAFWVARMRMFRRWISPLLALPLMLLTFPARTLGLVDRYVQIRRSVLER